MVDDADCNWSLLVNDGVYMCLHVFTTWIVLAARHLVPKLFQKCQALLKTCYMFDKQQPSL